MISARNNTLWSLTARIFNILIKSVAVIILARFLGPNEFGVFTLIISTAALFSVFIDLGFTPATARLLAESRWNNKEIIRISATIIGVTFTLFAFVFYSKSHHLFELLNAKVLNDFTFLFIALVLTTISTKYLKKCFEGLRRVDLSSKYSLLFEWAPWTFAIVFVFFLRPSAGYALSGKLLGMAIFVIALIYLLNKIGLKGKTEQIRSSVSTKRVFSYALPMMATAISFYIYTHSDILIIQGILGEKHVGIYGVAVKLMETLHVPAAAIGSGVAAFFVITKDNTKEKASKLLYNSSRLILLFFLPLAIGLAVTAHDLFPFVFGIEYKNAAIIAIIYTPTLLAKSLSGTYSLALDYMGFAKKRAIAISISALLNVGLNFVLIPKYGIIGAAITTQITYIPLFIWYSITLMKITGSSFKHLGKIILPIAISSVSMGALVFSINQLTSLHIIFQISIGAFTYLVLGLFLGVLKKTDITRIMKNKNNEPE